MSCFARRLRPQQIFFLPSQAHHCAAARATPVQILLGTRLRPSKRPFATTAELRYAAKPTPHRRPPPAAAKKPTPPAAAVGTPPAPRPAIRSYVEILSSKGHPTVLYEAPSHFWLRFSCFGAGLFCVSYTVVQYWTIYVHPPPGLSWWVPHAYGVVCMFMAGMGVWFTAGASGIVRSVRAMPATKAAIEKAAATTTATHAPLLVEVSTSRAMPFMPAKRVQVAPSEIKLPFRVAGLMAEWNAKRNPPQLSVTERLRAKRDEAERLEKKRKYELDHLMTAPFRHAGNAVVAAWGGVKRGLSREGFAKIKVKGVEYKFDVTGGWALDDGKALDRIVHVTR